MRSHVIRRTRAAARRLGESVVLTGGATDLARRVAAELHELQVRMIAQPGDDLAPDIAGGDLEGPPPRGVGHPPHELIDGPVVALVADPLGRAVAATGNVRSTGQFHQGIALAAHDRNAGQEQLVGDAHTDTPARPGDHGERVCD